MPGRSGRMWLSETPPIAPRILMALWLFATLRGVGSAGVRWPMTSGFRAGLFYAASAGAFSASNFVFSTFRGPDSSTVSSLRRHGWFVRRSAQIYFRRNCEFSTIELPRTSRSIRNGGRMVTTGPETLFHTLKCTPAIRFERPAPVKIVLDFAARPLPCLAGRSPGRSKHAPLFKLKTSRPVRHRRRMAASNDQHSKSIRLIRILLGHKEIAWMIATQTSQAGRNALYNHV